MTVYWVIQGIQEHIFLHGLQLPCVNISLDLSYKIIKVENDVQDWSRIASIEDSHFLMLTQVA